MSFMTKEKFRSYQLYLINKLREDFSGQTEDISIYHTFINSDGSNSLLAEKTKEYIRLYSERYKESEYFQQLLSGLFGYIMAHIFINNLELNGQELSDYDNFFDYIESYIEKTFEDKYENSILRPGDFICTDLGMGYNLICIIKYISRFIADSGEKRNNPKDLLKALHYIIMELTRLIYSRELEKTQ